MRLFIARHGQTDWNLRRIAQGHTDIALNSTGQQEAEALCTGLAHASVEEVWTSDLTRCVQTAGPFCSAKGIDPKLQPILREQAFGELEGSDYSRVCEFFRQNGSSASPPNGESQAEHRARVLMIVRELEQVSRSVLMVTHGGTGSKLLSALLLGDVLAERAFSLKNGRYTELHRAEEGHWKLIRYNAPDYA